MTLSILVAGAFFLAMPLRLVLRTAGVGGLARRDLRQAFRELRLPHNLFPSLHITLWTILADIYARHTRGLLRGASNVWFGLIGFSTVLT